MQPLVPLDNPLAPGCSVLVVVGLTAEFADSEQHALDTYLTQGARALFLLSVSPPLALHATLSRWGVAA